MAYDNLKHALRIRYGTNHHEPNDAQMQSIINYLNQLPKHTENDVKNAVYYYCPSAGTHRYASEDNSDVNSLLAQAISQAQNQ